MPDLLRCFVWKQPRTPLAGLREILRAPIKKQRQAFNAAPNQSPIAVPTVLSIVADGIVRSRTTLR